jgi:hypothetical protein
MSMTCILLLNFFYFFSAFMRPFRVTFKTDANEVTGAGATNEQASIQYTCYACNLQL